MPPELKAFIDGFKSVVIGTVDSQGGPFSSYAPFVREKNHYYVYVSEMARHTTHLLLGGQASLLFIEDESRSEQIFARKRAVLVCRAEEVARSNREFDSVLDLFGKKFDTELVTVLKGMQDFHLFRLTPTSGEAVFGFGEAFYIAEDGQTLIPRNKGAHRTSS